MVLNAAKSRLVASGGRRTIRKSSRKRGKQLHTLASLQNAKQSLDPHNRFNFRDLMKAIYLWIIFRPTVPRMQ